MLDWVILNYPSIYLQLARGHDKTDRFTWWLLLWMRSTKHAQAFACGVDRDNARLVRDSAKWQVEAHPRLFDGIQVQNYDIKDKKTGSTVRILASDEAGNYGLTPDLLIINDFHAWKNKGFFEALYTATGKRKGVRIWIESNALRLGTEQVQWIKPIRAHALSQVNQHPTINEHGEVQDEQWFAWVPEGFFATWQYHKLQEWKKILAPQTFRRLIENKDTSEGDQFLTEDQVTVCETSSTIRYDQFTKFPTRTVVAIDYGFNKDAATISVVLAYQQGGLKLVLLHQDVWVGTTEEPIDARILQKQADKYAKEYHAEKYTDPWEMRWLLVQDPTWEEFKFNASSVRLITTQLRQVFINKQIVIPVNCSVKMQGKIRKSEWSLKRELSEAVLKDMSYGQRVDHKAEGYTDRIMSLGIAVVKLLDDDPPPMRQPKKTKTETNKYFKLLQMPERANTFQIV